VDPDVSALSSLQRVIEASPKTRSFILHVDMPIFETSVYEALWKTSGEAVVPVFAGRRGHPVLLSPAVLAEISRLDSSKDRLDVFLRSRGAVEVPVLTEIIHRNLNESIS
jgi:molybdenum cofactor cytidylyltransferase